jgi:hypothetical protein
MAYVANRSIGMPGAMDDIGNWFEPFGLLSMAIEIFAAYHSVMGLITIVKINRLKTAVAAQ